MSEAGFEVLWDDRDLRTGEKFNDADLIGIPLRLVVSSRSLDQGGLEWKERREKESKIVPEEDLISALHDYYSA